MSKLLFQADDYGLTESTACGIIKGIRDGLIRNTGLFVNMPASEIAAKMIKDIPEVCLGIDYNFVAGKPVSDPKDVPSLVDDEGFFISSTQRMVGKFSFDSNKMVYEFDQDPYPYEEVLLESENQIQRFVTLVGRFPEYLHGHSLITGNIYRVFKEISLKYQIPLSFEAFDKGVMVPANWNDKPFDLAKQLQTNVEEKLFDLLPSLLDNQLNIFICHAGYVEQELFEYSGYTIIRIKDLAAATSNRIKNYIKDNNIELITYRDL